MNRSRFFDMDKKLMIKVIAGMIFLVVAFAFYLIKDHDGEQDAEISIITEAGADTIEKTTESSIEKKSEIMVDVSGAVKNPYVVMLQEGSRVFQAVEKAGGYTADADTRVINQAEILSDGQKLYIPTKQEVEKSQNGSTAYDQDLSGSNAASSYSVSGFTSGGSSGQSKININTADSAALQQLTGVGPATAEKIITYRNENGKFKSIEDIKNVSGIGDKTYEKFEDLITI